MASRVPQARKAGGNRRQSNAKQILDYLKEIGPQPELADAIESAYRERHANVRRQKRGHPKRQQSTRAL